MLEKYLYLTWYYPPIDRGGMKEIFTPGNVSFSYDNGTVLLYDGKLQLAHTRRYDLVGKNE